MVYILNFLMKIVKYYESETISLVKGFIFLYKIEQRRKGIFSVANNEALYCKSWIGDRIGKEVQHTQRSIVRGLGCIQWGHDIVHYNYFLSGRHTLVKIWYFCWKHWEISTWHHPLWTMRVGNLIKPPELFVVMSIFLKWMGG